MTLDALVNTLKIAVDAGLLTQADAAAFLKSKLGIQDVVVEESVTPTETPAEQPAQ